MTKQEIKKLARKSYKDGPCISFDSKGDGYWSYVVFVRIGIKYTVLIVDEAIAELNGNTVDFLASEIKFAIEGMQSTPLSQTEISPCP